MTVVNKADALFRAEQIRIERAGASNTAQRVGSLLVDMVDSTFGAAADVTTLGISPTNPGAVNDAAIAAAIAAALASGSELYWPGGIYPSAASIPDFHAVRHRGTGGIQRGADLFFVEPRAAQVNTLYLDPAGSPTNDGLSAAQPMAGISAFITALRNYGYLDGTWRCSLSAGAHVGGTTVTGLRSRNPIEFFGPSVGGHPNAPTAELDGALGGTIGVFFLRGVSTLWRDVGLRNYPAGAGLEIEEESQIVAQNVHATNCLYGFYFGNEARGVIDGGILQGCGTGVRVYAASGVRVGVSAARPLLSGNQYGVRVSDNSWARCNELDITSSTGAAIFATVGAVVSSTGPAFNSNAIAVHTDLSSHYFEAAASYVGNTVDRSGVQTLTGSGSPEGAVRANPGSLFLRTDGAAATTLYVKTSGTGNTGWTAK